MALPGSASNSRGAKVKQPEKARIDHPIRQDEPSLACQRRQETARVTWMVNGTEIELRELEEKGFLTVETQPLSAKESFEIVDRLIFFCREAIEKAPLLKTDRTKLTTKTSMLRKDYELLLSRSRNPTPRRAREPSTSAIAPARTLGPSQVGPKSQDYYSSPLDSK